MNLKNGDKQQIQINRTSQNKLPKSHIKTAQIKETIKNKINHKDNSAHCLFMLQCMMGAVEAFLKVTVVVNLMLILAACVSKLKTII